MRNLLLFPALRKFEQVAIWETNQNNIFLLLALAAYPVQKAMKFIMVASLLISDNRNNAAFFR